MCCCCQTDGALGASADMPLLLLKRSLHDSAVLVVATAGLMVYRATQRTLEEVKSLMASPETPQAALERVSRQLGGAKAGADDDDEDDFVMGNTVTSLRDPFTNMRIQVPVR